MKKCLRITLAGQANSDFLKKTIQAHAQKLDIEGSAQYVEENKEIKIIACGDSEKVEKFLDIIHTETARIGIETVSVEPFIKDKEYRGVFRIIE